MINFDEYKHEIFNDLIYDLQDACTRFVINYGGAGSGKSFTQTQHELIKCIERKEKLLVVRKYATTLKDSVISLFNSIASDWDLTDLYEENKSDRTFSFVNGSQVLFKGLDDPEKIKSIAGVTRVWIEEASELTFEDFKQINLRLRGSDRLQMTLTFNPIDIDHWIKKHFFDNVEINSKCTILKTTYKDNKFIDDAYKQELESYKNFDRVYYDVYCLGEWGVITEGRIFSDYFTIDKMPNLTHWYGLDFGYSNDPTAIVKTCKNENKLFFDEICYQKGLTNSDIARIIKQDNYNYEPVICDSSEPKSIDELRLIGINAIPAEKGAGSITSGIDYLKRHTISVTKNSSNILRENKFYRWKERKDGSFDRIPQDAFNHAHDAMRYAYSVYKDDVLDDNFII